MEEDKDDNDCASTTKSSKPLVIKYSDFLAACIDERRVLTREKVNLITKFSCGLFLSILIHRMLIS